MSSSLYNQQWQKAQAELRQLVKEDLNLPPEPPTDGTGDAQPPPPPVPEPINDRLQVIDMLRLRFVKYLRIIKNLNECYDQIVHPQKRMLLRKLLDGTIGRLLEVKKELVALDCSEFHYFDDILSDLKLTPDDLKMPIPKYFLQQEAVIEKIQTLQAKMNWGLGGFLVFFSFFEQKKQKNENYSHSSTCKTYIYTQNNEPLNRTTSSTRPLH